MLERAGGEADAMPLSVSDHLALALDQMGPATCNGRSNGDVRTALGQPSDEQYLPCLESQGDAPSGNVVSFDDVASERYPGTTRKIWLYTPAMRVLTAPNRLILFNDGGAYLAREGPARATKVLDTLHQTGELTNTFGVFIQAGQSAVMPKASPLASYGIAEAQRSWENDRLTNDYSFFLSDEVMPFAASQLDIKWSTAPADILLCGISSGGIAAFTAAWHQPQRFQNVLSHCGSFTNIWGGHNFPYLVRTTPRKPLKVFLQSGANDAETLFGDWATANQAMFKALVYAGYDVRFEFGEGGHTLRHGGALLADSLRWFWPV